MSHLKPAQNPGAIGNCPTALPRIKAPSNPSNDEFYTWQRYLYTFTCPEHLYYRNINFNSGDYFKLHGYLAARYFHKIGYDLVSGEQFGLYSVEGVSEKLQHEYFNNMYTSIDPINTYSEEAG